MVQVQAIDNIFQVNSPFQPIPSQWDCKHRALRVEVRLCLALCRVKVVSVHSEISLAVSQGTAHPLCPLPRLGISRAAFDRLSLVLGKASAENYFLLWMQISWRIGAGTASLCTLASFASHLGFSPCIMVSGWCPTFMDNQEKDSATACDGMSHMSQMPPFSLANNYWIAGLEPGLGFRI